MIATSLTSSSKGELSLAIGWFWCNPFFEKGKKITNKKRKNFHWVIFAIFLFKCTAACFHMPSTENVSFNHINSKDLRDHVLQRSSRSCLVKFPCSIFYALFSTKKLNHSNFLAIGFSAEICGFLDNHSFDKLGFSNNIRQHWMIEFL